jgi:hypothetical protein
MSSAWKEWRLGGRWQAAALAAGIGLCAALAPAAAVDPLSDEELKKVFTGNTFSGLHFRSGNTFTEYHAPDGRVIGHNGIEINTDGCWYVREGAICYAYGKPGDRRTYCFIMHRTGGSMTLTALPDRTIIGLGILEEGNPRNHKAPNPWSCEELTSRNQTPRPRLEATAAEPPSR